MSRVSWSHLPFPSSMNIMKVQLVCLFGPCLWSPSTCIVWTRKNNNTNTYSDIGTLVLTAVVYAHLCLQLLWLLTQTQPQINWWCHRIAPVFSTCKLKWKCLISRRGCMWECWPHRASARVCTAGTWRWETTTTGHWEWWGNSQPQKTLQNGSNESFLVSSLRGRKYKKGNKPAIDIEDDKRPNVIRLQLDFYKGQLRFIDPFRNQILCSFNGGFPERVFPYFCTGDSLTPLNVFPANRQQQWIPTNITFFLFLHMLCFVHVPSFFKTKAIWFDNLSNAMTFVHF